MRCRYCDDEIELIESTLTWQHVYRDEASHMPYWVARCRAPHDDAPPNPMAHPPLWKDRQ